MLMPALQLVVGLQAPWFPRIVAERSIDANLVKQFGLRAVEYIEYMERFVRPRWLWLSTGPAPALLGVIVFCLAFILMIPLPFSNFLPAVALICFALGLMERDGAIIFAGLIVAVFAIAVGAVAVNVTVRTLVPGLFQQFQ